MMDEKLKEKIRAAVQSEIRLASPRNDVEIKAGYYIADIALEVLDQYEKIKNSENQDT